MALEQNDLIEIRKVVKDEVFDGFSRIWEDNIESVMATKAELAEKPSTKHLDARLEQIKKEIVEG